MCGAVKAECRFKSPHPFVNPLKTSFFTTPIIGSLDKAALKVSMKGNVDYIFKAEDSNTSDCSRNNMTAVKVTVLGQAGSLRLNGVEVTPNQRISMVDMDMPASCNLRRQRMLRPKDTGHSKNKFYFSLTISPFLNPPPDVTAPMANLGIAFDT